MKKTRTTRKIGNKPKEESCERRAGYLEVVLIGYVGYICAFSPRLRDRYSHELASLYHHRIRELWENTLRTIREEGK